MSNDFKGIEGNFSKEHILAEYESGRQPNLLMVIVCTVCDVPVASELLAPLSHANFLKFLSEGVIQERNGQYTWITDKSATAICDLHQTVMEKMDQEEGIVLYPPKKINPFT